jgi:LmbE family N-acetylglucosaminyl deacetylase
MERILIVAAHPDDETLGCGGLIAKLGSAASVRVVFLAEGTTCRYEPNQIGSAAALADIAARADSARRALDVLGVREAAFYDHPCGRLDQVPILELNQIIEKEIANHSPDTVLTHSEHDVNNDHRIVCRSVSMATRPVGSHQVPTLMCFETPSSTEWSFISPFEPNHFELLSVEDLALKWKALACYESETQEYPHPRSREGIETLARYRGMQVGVPYAEAFRIVRTVVA